MQRLVKDIFSLLKLQAKAVVAVHGGDINRAFAVVTSSEKYFVKLNPATAYPHMFQKEAEGLSSLQPATSLVVPAVISYGEIETQQYLVLGWLEQASTTTAFWKEFAEGLVQLHRTSNEYFGFTSDNCIGSLTQRNDSANSWSEFYATQRLIPLVKQLFNNGSFSLQVVQAADRVCSKLPGIFPGEPPALLHGDLWSGNFMAVATAAGNIKPAIYDPAVYYGHREMDIGMTLLFGGFDRRFYSHYNEMYPLEKNWQQRISLTQLYPLLVHAELFGGTYVDRCRKIIDNWK